MANHYAILYFDDPSTYANSLMSLFFLLSGAGIYLSLKRDFAAAGKASGALVKYLYKRISRIYPLYWLAYAVFLIELFAFDQFVGTFSGFNFVTALVGAPTYPRGIFWFVTAILQCYLFAPLLYLVIRRQGAMSALGTALMLMAGSLLVTVFLLDHIGYATLRDMLEYKELFLGNVLLFFLGMLIPSLLSRDQGALARTGVWVAGAAGFAFFTYVTDSPDRLFPGSEVYLAPLLFLSAFIFCISIMAAAPRLPLGGVLRLHGDNSYPLYLMHQSFFILLVAVGIIQDFSYASIVYTLLLYPLFLVVCVALQSLFQQARSGLGDRLFKTGSAGSRIGQS
jgi:peptidoglycan/LPS O-acetylase OafA/YrhL